MGIDKNTLLEYADIKAQIKELEARAKELAPGILGAMTSSGAEEIDVKGTGKFILSPYRTWTYPQELVIIEEDLKAKKKEAEQKGTATYVEKPVLKFNFEKKDGNNENI